jgi:glycolate oxidase FAD binding subunit
MGLSAGAEALPAVEPASREELAGVLTAASAEGRRLLPVGGRTHLDKGNPTVVDAELSVRKLNRVVACEAAEMIAVVEAGLTVGELDAVLAEQGQEWPVDAAPEATVGGVVATAPSSPRRLAVGAVRDSVLELHLVTGDGRALRAGHRTVKNVAGFDLCKLLTGSLGTLGVITQVALRLRPRPRARRTLTFPVGGAAGNAAGAAGARDASGPFALAAELLAAAPLAAAVLVTPGEVVVRLEGWQADVEEQAATAVAAAGIEPASDEQGTPFPRSRAWLGAPVVAEAALPPSRLPELAAAAGDNWAALAGVGILWAGLPDTSEPLAALRARAAELGGIAPVVRGSGGLGPGLPAAAVHQRIKRAFDPAGILAPGRFWGGL